MESRKVQMNYLYRNRFLAVSGKEGVTIWWDGLYMAVLLLLFGFRFRAALVYAGANMMQHNMLLYEGALIKSNAAEKVIAHGATRLYSDILSLLFTFLGNKQTVVYYFQYFLQVVTVILLFAAVRMLYGRIPAYVTGFCLGISVEFTLAVSSFGPEVVYLFFWSAVLLTAGLYAGRPLAGFTKVLLPLLAGGLIGILGFGDIIGFSLLPLWLAIGVSKGKTLPETLFPLTLGGVLGFGVMVWQWPLILPAAPEAVPLLAVLMLLTALLVVLLIKSKNIAAIPWLMLLVPAFSAEPIFGVYDMNYHMWIMLYMAAILGLIVQKMLKKEELAVTGQNQESGMERETESREKSRYDTSTGIKYINNPLPLPKKPVKKGMDYSVVVSEKDMKYDIEVADDDDFDLK